MRKGELLFSVFITLNILCSCQAHRYIYSPAPSNIPYFKQKGDTKLTADYSAGFDNENNQGFDIQGAYAFTNHFAIAAAYSGRTETDTYSYYPNSMYNIFDSSVVQYKRSMTEISAGWFTPINKKKTITYNLYGGFALGKFSIQDAGLDSTGANYTRSYTSNLSKIFLQGGFNFMRGKNFHFSFTGRLSWVHYGNNTSSYTGRELQYFYLDKIANQTLFFYEPAFNFQIGLRKWLKLDVTETLCTGLPENYPPIRGLIQSAGLTVDLSKIGRSKK